MIYPIVMAGLVFRLLSNRAKKQLARLQSPDVTEATTVVGSVPSEVSERV